MTDLTIVVEWGREKRKDRRAVARQSLVPTPDAQEMAERLHISAAS